MDRGLELGTSLTSNGAAPLQNARPPVNRAARVLVVDDDILGADLRVVLLRSLGYDAEVSNSGTEAIGRTDINEFDIVLLDHDMPILNGIQTAQKLRETGTYSIIVMFSGRTDIPPDAGGVIDAFVSKGGGVSSLKFALASILERRELGSERSREQFSALFGEGPQTFH